MSNDPIQPNSTVYEGVAVFKTRSIGGIVANVTIEEEFEDEMAITDHPVEAGADVSDHMYSEPRRLIVRCAWSNSDDAATGDDYCKDIYAQMRALQKSRQLVTIYTGLDVYENMAIKIMKGSTTQDTENALFLTLMCRELILVDSQDIVVPANAVQQTPQLNGTTQNLSQQSLQPTVKFNSSNPTA